MRVAVLGAGIAGLVAARRLVAGGHHADVYERWPGLGGQVATMEVAGGDRLEHYYHHLFTSDVEIASLYEELGMGDAIEWLPSSVAVFRDGRSHPFTSPADLLRFRPLSPLDRVRTGIGALRAARTDPRSVERMTAREWVRSRMGDGAWEVIWGPLLRAKFGDRADGISAAWLVSKLGVRRRVGGREARREVLGYPRGGWQPLLDRLAAEISRSGRVMIDRPARSIGRDENGKLIVEPGAPASFRRGHDPAGFDPAEGPVAYDAIVATVPSDIFTALLSPALRAELGREYLAQLGAAEYQAALCLVCETDRPLSPFYWTNIADPEIPFIGVIEHANLVGTERYGGRRFLYVANYLERRDPLLGLGAEELLEHYTPGLRRINPGFGRSWVGELRRFAEPAAQPVVTVGYADTIPALATPAPGLVLANTTQIYPEDRGTNYSVRLGERAVHALRAHDGGAPGS